MNTYKNTTTKCFEVYTNLDDTPKGYFPTLKEAMSFGSTLGKEEYYVQEKLFTCFKWKGGEPNAKKDET